MIDIIRKILNEKYVVTGDNRKIIIYSAKMTYPEDCIEIEEKNGTYFVNRIVRSSHELIIETRNHDETIIGACILASRMIEPLKKDEKVNRIKNLMANGKMDEAVEYLRQEFSDDLYVIGRIEENKVSLLARENQADVLFRGEYLAQDASLQRSFAVLYNYCKKMKYIKEWYSHLEDEYEVTLELCEKLYLLGKA